MIGFCSALREVSITALAGQRIHGSIETALTATFELLNLVPADQLNPLKSAYNHEKYDRHSSKSGGGVDATERDSNKRLAVTLSSADNSEVLSKWRRVGSVSGTSVRLDTIIWPGGDIVVSGECCLRCYLLLSRVLETIRRRYWKCNFRNFIFVAHDRLICTCTFGIPSCDSIGTTICHGIGIR